MSCLDADPEMASLNMGTLMRQTGPNAGEPFSNMTKDIEAWAAKMKEMQHQARDGVLLPEHVPGRAQPHHEGAHRAAVLRQLRARHDAPGRHRGERRTRWSPCTSSCRRTATSTPPPPAPPQLPLTTMAHDHGRRRARRPRGQHLLPEGRARESNAQLVERTVRIARELNLSLPRRTRPERSSASSRSTDPGRDG